LRVFNDFKCADGHVSEMFVPMDQKVVPCPTCGKEATKVITALTVVFKGQGFPSNDDNWAKRHEHHGDTAKLKRGETIG
jgi:putative FmdB family regulatory protein